VSAINEAKLRAFLARALYDLAAAQSVPLVVIGDRLGLYRAMAGAGPLSAEELARRTGTDARYVAEWLFNQATGGYVEFDSTAGTFSLPEEHARVLAEEDGPMTLLGAFQLAAGLATAYPEVAAAFGSGAAVEPARYAEDVFAGIERAARARARAVLVPAWIPALDGVAPALERGALVADIGCGRGAVLMAVAAAYPRSRYVGFDRHAPSLERARTAAVAAAVADRVRFETAPAANFPGGDYDFVMTVDTVHELADPPAVARRIRAALAADGTWLIVEPYIAERVEDNVGPLGRLLSTTSALYCLPTSRGDGAAMGVGVGERRLSEIAAAAGFTRVRRVTESPFSLVLEVRT
jgi:SAM-dependent methyltransferase